MTSIHSDLTSPRCFNLYTMSVEHILLDVNHRPVCKQRIRGEDEGEPIPASPDPASKTTSNNDAWQSPSASLPTGPTVSESLPSNISSNNPPTINTTLTSISPVNATSLQSPPASSDALTTTTTTVLTSLSTGTTIITGTSISTSITIKTKITTSTFITTSPNFPTAETVTAAISSPAVTSSISTNKGAVGAPQEAEPSPTSFNTTTTSTDSRLGSGPLAGIIVGAVAFVVLVLAALFLLRKKFRNTQRAPSGQFKESGWGDRLVESPSPGQSFGGGIDRYDIERIGARTPSTYEDAISGIVEALDPDHVVPELPHTIPRKPPPTDSPVMDKPKVDKGQLRDSQVSEANVGIAS